MKKVTFISDTHTRHNHINLEGGDILCFSGDFMSAGYNITEVFDFLDWFRKQPYKYKICVAGNHDRYCEAFPTYQIKDMFEKYYDEGVRYIQDEEIEVDGLKIYGTPYQPYFFNWAFNVKDSGKLTVIFSQIPENLDILITHCPPYDILDKSHRPGYENTTGESPLGSKELSDVLGQMENPPRYHCFGHIHGDGGKTQTVGKTTYINASVCDEGYKPTNKIITLEIEPRG